ncbi:MAG: hypothetical protein N0A16_04905 [Blastocatellia bacterium]|nr:hypothetical protein [Blastocatellia bacterium]MCS7157051.1 hypothetical protein [Blastocatellia bacterium]MCX7752252.1 hypothetical protein [Blastocatellia bacterium]MDW8167744.1 hypothetical protein [Acidobacteriota bacterium]MDW8256788.1 hypothetical protein [Acidobacteriota bacterium]
MATASPNEAELSPSRLDFQRALEALDALLEALDEGDWAQARERFAEFEQIVRTLPAPDLEHPEMSFALMDFFHLYRVQLERALLTEDATGAIFACNQLGDIMWDLRAQFERAPVPELGRLHYLGRDLRYWSEVGDEKMVRLRALGVEKTWSDVRPIIAASGEKALISRFDELLERLHTARTMEDYRAIALMLEEAIHQLEAQFAREREPR